MQIDVFEGTLMKILSFNFIDSSMRHNNSMVFCQIFIMVPDRWGKLTWNLWCETLKTQMPIRNLNEILGNKCTLIPR